MPGHMLDHLAEHLLLHLEIRLGSFANVLEHFFEHWTGRLFCDFYHGFTYPSKKRLGN